MPGSLALILHAHLPFVRHPEHAHFVEEEWLFEAITETYVPLLQMMERLTNDGVPFKLTMSISPTLCAMLQDQLLRERYVRHLDLLIDLAARERKRNRKHPQLFELAEFYISLFSETRQQFVDEWNCDLLSGFRELRQTGALEVIASAATHGLLPIIEQQSARAARAQVLIGRDVYVELFGEEPDGFWLPECGYAPGLESILQKANLRWFVVDAHGLLFGTPRPCRSIYGPCYTPAGPAAFARDPHASRQVWSAHEGYPGDPAYREFYRDIGFDLPMEHLGSIARGIEKILRREIPPDHGTRRLRNNCMTEQQPKMRQHNMRIHFLEQCRQQIRKSANSVSTRSLSLRSMRNCLVTGGSKDQFSWNNSYATQQTNQISGSQRRVNIWPHIRRSKSLSPLLQHGVRTAILPSGSIRVTPGFIRNCNAATHCR